jgi:hypothetical protein
VAVDVAVPVQVGVVVLVRVGTEVAVLVLVADGVVVPHDRVKRITVPGSIRPELLQATSVNRLPVSFCTPIVPLFPGEPCVPKINSSSPVA